MYNYGTKFSFFERFLRFAPLVSMTGGIKNVAHSDGEYFFNRTTERLNG